MRSNHRSIIQGLARLRAVACRRHERILASTTTARLASSASNPAPASSPNPSLSPTRPTHQRYGSPSSFSSLALASEEDNYDDDDDSFRWDEDEEADTAPTDKHCVTCTCEGDDTHSHTDHSHERLDHSHAQPLLPAAPLPPPLPAPKYSFRRRVMPENLIPLNSTEGRRFLIDAMINNTAASYISLTEHFSNQSEPAYCGVTTLQMTLNALAVDPNVRWKGGWRYFGSEDVLLGHCCIDPERVRRIGITMEEFAQLGSCQGLRVNMKHAVTYDLDDFRSDVQHWLLQPEQDLAGILVVSFSRHALGQTGDGHFSPIAAYHEESDQVLILDVARFKYQPYWVSVQDLYNAMCPPDTATNKPRGWYVLRPPAVSASYKGMRITSEELRPAQLVPAVGENSLCPMNHIKIDFCKAARRPKDP